jgi:membrane associated rhomboid family serine protease
MSGRVRCNSISGVGARTAWAVVTGALIIGWAVVVALVIAWLTGWSTDVKAAVGGVVAGAGAALILFWRMQRRP